MLLKNEGDLLPLSPDLPTLYVGGTAADDIGIQSGGWTIEWQGAVILISGRPLIVTDLIDGF
jgi:beta-glucosidase-like glycosyl hydrolase